MEQFQLILEDFKAGKLPPAREVKPKPRMIQQQALDMPAPVVDQAPTRPRVILTMPDQKQADKFRALAEGLQAKIDHGRADRQTNTAKRLGQAMQARRESDRLERCQQVLNKLADLHQVGTMPQILRQIKNKAQIYDLMAAELRNVPNGYHAYHVETGRPRNSDPLTLAAWELLQGKSPEQEHQEALERKLASLRLYSTIPGYFPTPPAVIARMLDYANIRHGMSVLEPSAGDGAIVAAVQALDMDNFIVAYEIAPQLCEVLQMRGFDARPFDFMLQRPGQMKYDRVLMNPPFEKLQDVDHVRHAFEFLASGGRLVAIMSQGGFFREDRKATEFREWLHGLTYEAYNIEAGAFKESGTGIATKLVIIDKD